MPAEGDFSCGWFVAAVVGVMTSGSAFAGEEIVGTYRLVGDQRKIVETGEVISESAPAGFITYGKEGRMQVIIVRQPRPKVSPEQLNDQQRADLYKTVTAYGGTYKFDGKTVEHAVDISWNETWSGTRQQRFVTLQDDRLIITTPIYRSQVDGKESINILTWERVK